MRFKEQSLREKIAFKRAIREAEDDAIAGERARFEGLRKELRSKRDSDESAAREEHEKEMASLMLEREKQLHAMKQSAADRAQLEEADRLARGTGATGAEMQLTDEQREAMHRYRTSGGETGQLHQDAESLLAEHRAVHEGK